MTELLTAAQMRAIERAAIESGAVTGLELMERAGRGVVDAIFAHWPELSPSGGPAPSPLSLGPMAQQRRPPEFILPDEGQERRAVVLCGPGNNGGDGFVVARLLREAGWAVEVFLYGDAEKLPPDARVNHDRWCDGGTVSAMTERAVRQSRSASVHVDAIFGTGLNRPATGDLASLLRYLAGGGGDHAFCPERLVAVDVPSGLCADSGMVLGGVDAPYAALTVTFDSPKIGHFIGQGPDHCGHLHCVDIGLAAFRARVTKGPFADRAARPHQVRLVGSEPLVPDERSLNFLSSPLRGLSKRQGHKYDHGHGLIVSGGVGRGGAARMAARGALRIGAGAVTVGCPPAALIENAAQLNAVMLRSLKDADALTTALDDKRINALCLGPGLGTGPREAALVAVALQAGRNVVLDADALTLLSRDAGLFGQLHEGCVLTPHAGEFARLFPDIAEKLDAPAMTGPAYSKVDATRDAAKRAGCVVLFKGPDTVIAAPKSWSSVNAAVYDRAAPWLATAGAGDVLAGFITGLLARGFAPIQAAEAAAWLHVECARAFGPGLIAEDLPEALPGVLRALGA